MVKKERLSRAQFLSLAGRLGVSTALAYTGADAFLAHVAGLNTVLTPFFEELETSTIFRPKFITEVEKDFTIKIFDPLEPTSVTDPRLRQTLGLAAVNRLVGKNPNGLLCGWDKPRIALLREVVSQLPVDFYTSSRSPVNFVLWQGQGMARRKLDESDQFRGTCVCSPTKEIWDYLTETSQIDKHPPCVVFVKRDLRTLFGKDRYSARELVVHELTHLKILQPENFINGRNIIIDQALNSLSLPQPVNYEDPDQNLIDLFRRHIETTYDTDKETTDAHPKESDLIGVSIKPQELIPVAAELYFEGYSVFAHTYITDLGQPSTDHFYEFMRQSVFEGRQYPSKY